MDKPEFYRKKLENGPIVLFERRNIPVITIIGGVPFGSAYENEKFRGIAHYIEHMAFKGTKTKSYEEIRDLIEKVGGNLNAFTSKEITAYWTKMPSKYLERGVDVISDIMLNPSFNKKEMEKERKVIFEEIKMNHDVPAKFVVRKAEELMYEKPFGFQTIGSEETLNRVSQKIMFDTHRAYCPQDMIVSVVGKASPDDIFSIVKEKFCVKKPRDKLKNIEVRHSYGEFIERRDNIQQAAIALNFHAPSGREKLRYAAEAFNTIFGKGSSSRLFDEIREKRGLAYTANSEYVSERSYGYIGAFIGTTKEKVREVKKITLDEIKKMRYITQKELDTAKEQMIGNFEVNQEESEKVAVDLLMEELAGNAEGYYDYEKKVNSIKLCDLKSIAKIKGYSFVVVIPKN